jgi:putative ABC transport system permease protein
VPALAGLAATRGRDATLVRDGGAGVAAERLAGAAVSGQFFAVAGLGPARGRLLGPADDRPGRRACWCSATPRGGACSGATRPWWGRTLRLDGEPHTVVGVAAAALDALTGGAEFFAPLALDPSQRANFTPYLTLVARLAPGTTPAAAERGLDAVVARLGAPALVDGARQRVRAVPLDARLTGDYRRPLLLLLGAVGAVLAIACANVGTLVLARSLGRARELAVRVSFGAGPRAAGPAAPGRARWCSARSPWPWPSPRRRSACARWWPPRPRACRGWTRPRWTGARSPWRGAGLAASLLSGVLPALWQGRVDVRGVLQQGGRAATDRAGARWRRALVAAEVAAALALLAGAGLLGAPRPRSARWPRATTPGRVLTARFALPERDYPELAAAVRGYEAVVAAARREPGVAAAAAVSRVPLGGAPTSVDVARADRPFTRDTRVSAGSAWPPRLLRGARRAAPGRARPGRRRRRARARGGRGERGARPRLAPGADPRAAVGLRFRSDNSAFAGRTARRA